MIIDTKTLTNPLYYSPSAVVKENNMYKNYYFEHFGENKEPDLQWYYNLGHRYYPQLLQLLSRLQNYKLDFIRNCPDPFFTLLTMCSIVANYINKCRLWLIIVGPHSTSKSTTLSRFETLRKKKLVCYYSYIKPKHLLQLYGLRTFYDAVNRCGTFINKDMGSWLRLGYRSTFAVYYAMNEFFDNDMRLLDPYDYHWKGKIGIIMAIDNYAFNKLRLECYTQRFLIYNVNHYYTLNYDESDLSSHCLHYINYIKDNDISMTDFDLGKYDTEIRLMSNLLWRVYEVLQEDVPNFINARYELILKSLLCSLALIVNNGIVNDDVFAIFKYYLGRAFPPSMLPILNYLQFENKYREFNIKYYIDLSRFIYIKLLNLVNMGIIEKKDDLIYFKDDYQFLCF